MLVLVVPAWVHGPARPAGGVEKEFRMVGDQARVLTLRDEYWDIAFEMPRPRALEAVEKDRARMDEIVEELGRLGTDVGPRPADLPQQEE